MTAKASPDPCPDCMVPRDPALDRATPRIVSHPTCPRPAVRLRAVPRPREPVPADACDVGWKCPAAEPPMSYPVGKYCGHHARMMIPRGQWPVLRVPEPSRTGPAARAQAGGEAEALDLEAEPG